MTEESIIIIIYLFILITVDASQLIPYDLKLIIG